MKCNNCGSTFEMADKRIEKQGEYWGSPAYEEFYVCPNCGDTDIEETNACINCGKESEHDICNECVELFSDDNVIFKYSNDREETINISGIFAYLFSRDEIEKILMKELMNSGKWSEDKDDFIKSDYEDYIDWLEEHIDEL